MRSFFTAKRPRIFTKRLYMQKIEYFETRKGDYVDTYGDVKVADPYQWLEDPGLNSSNYFFPSRNYF